MPITLRSETRLSAPNGRPNSRLVVGVGETVDFRASTSVRWFVGGDARRGFDRSLEATFDRPGEVTVRAEAGSEWEELRLTVVAPSLRYQKVCDLPVPHGVVGLLSRRGQPIPPELTRSVGVAMELKVLLTPLSVSFAGLQVRERDCPADQVWGVFGRPGMAPSHRATAGWVTVGADNVLSATDLAAACWNPARLNWPVPAGGYRWRIPCEYRLANGPVERFADPTSQAVRFDPIPTPTPSARGTFIIWKGGFAATSRV
jgi:hypothetical protein